MATTIECNDNTIELIDSDDVYCAICEAHFTQADLRIIADGSPICPRCGCNPFVE